MSVNPYRYASVKEGRLNGEVYIHNYSPRSYPFFSGSSSPEPHRQLAPVHASFHDPHRLPTAKGKPFVPAMPPMTGYVNVAVSKAQSRTRDRSQMLRDASGFAMLQAARSTDSLPPLTHVNPHCNIVAYPEHATPTFAY